MPSMPEEGEQFKFDARVGQWDNGKLIGYFQDKGHVRDVTWRERDRLRTLERRLMHSLSQYS